MSTDIDNWIYKTDAHDKIRYVLGIKGDFPLVCIGVNPSTAKPDQLDNTLKAVKRLSFKNGYDSFQMLNLYPQRATNPDNLHKRFNKKIHDNNLHEIEKIFSLKNVVIWAAWGTLIEKRPYLLKSLLDIYELSLNKNCTWITIGPTSKKGHPHHPLYLRTDSKIYDFVILDYLKNNVPGF